MALWRDSRAGSYDGSGTLRRWRRALARWSNRGASAAERAPQTRKHQREQYTRSR